MPVSFLAVGLVVAVAYTIVKWRSPSEPDVPKTDDKKPDGGQADASWVNVNSPVTKTPKATTVGILESRQETVEPQQEEVISTNAVDSIPKQVANSAENTASWVQDLAKTSTEQPSMVFNTGGVSNYPSIFELMSASSDTAPVIREAPRTKRTLSIDMHIPGPWDGLPSPDLTSPRPDKPNYMV